MSINTVYISIAIAFLLVILIIAFGVYNLSKVEIKKSKTQLKKERKMGKRKSKK